MADKSTPPSERPVPAAILVGGSSGAIEVVSQLLGALPGGFAPAIVVVIHQPSHRPSALCGVLSGKCQLPLREPQDKEPLAPSTVYLAPAGYHLLIDRGPSFSLSVDPPVNFSIPSIDVLFESAADVLESRCAGILVSGANEDGARGLRAMQEAGGMVVIQAPDDAAQSRMPQAAVALCPGAYVLSAKGICQWLQQLSTVRSPAGWGAR